MATIYDLAVVPPFVNSKPFTILWQSNFIVNQVRIGLKFISFLLLLNLGSAIHPGLLSQSVSKCRIEALKLKSVITKYHVSPPQFDTAFSAKVFNSFLEDLDEKKSFFTPADFQLLNKYKCSIFSDLENPAWNFPEVVQKLYVRKLLRYDSLIRIILSRPLDFNVKETLQIGTKTVVDLSSEKEISKYLKYKILRYAFAAQDSAITEQDFLKREAEARSRVLKNETARLSKFLKKPEAVEEFVNTSFLNAIAQCSDPHSEYMSIARKQEFESGLKPEALSFGFYISSTEDDELVIDDVIPGGSAWNSQLINKGDIITGFRLPGEEITQVADIGIEEANDILGSPDIKQVEFHLRKKDGTPKVALLVKSKINQDDVIVKGFILQGNTKVGYISLPEFYNDFENQSALGCANDVAKQCIMLQKENISGLIIDLRNNGGGSIKEAVDLSGLFIDFGPVCKLKQNDNGISMLKDFNRGIAYGGPLIILVNGLSASASEIFAGAMQDYNRAVIVGSQTYGKATGQVIVPCDSGKNNKNEGYVKITTDKIYRVTGKSNQKTGVTPDVIVSDFDLMNEYKESNEPYALANDSIAKSNFKALTALPVGYLRAQSLTRTTDKTFRVLESLTDSVIYYTADFKMPLDFHGFKTYVRRKNNIVRRFDKFQKETTSIFKVMPLQFDEPANSLSSDFMKEQLENIEKDVYLQEAFNIMIDLARKTTKP